MEQGTVSTPSRFTFDRFTATGVWYPGSAVPAVDGGYHLGVIDGQTLDEGISREKVMIGIDGAVELEFEEIVSVAPVFELKGKQFMTTILPILLMGVSAGVRGQGGSTPTRTITAVLGKVIDLGPVNISSVIVKDAATGLITYVSGVDYFVDLKTGQIRFPNVAAGITDGESLNVTFTQPPITREVYTAFSNLNQSGQLQLFMMASLLQPPVFEILIPGSLSRDKGNSGDPFKTDEWKLRFAVEGQPTILRLGALDDWLYT